jgi:hypothetical protein
MRKLIYLLVLTGLLGACSNKEDAVPSQPDMNAVRAKLAFTCAHEADHLPPLDPQADALFKYGLSLEKKPGPKDFSAAARYYRIAAAYGHYKANSNLQRLVSTSLASSPDALKETIDLTERLIKDGIPGGYYDMGHYLEIGYGVVKDEKKALVFIRKAADMGSPEAQAYVAELIAPSEGAADIARQMRQCAATQGYGKAANIVAIDFQDDGRFADALSYFQEGVVSGDTQSAWALENAFQGQKVGALYYLALPHDPERSRRYRLIGEFLDANGDRNAKVPDVDQIVPLPPAKLPPWDGTFQWQKEQDAAVLPGKPAEELVERLAREKNLDPATGLPLTCAKSAAAQRVPLGTIARTGEACPHDGVWIVRQWRCDSPEATRRFSKGQTMPVLVVSMPRMVPGLDALLGMRFRDLAVEWSLDAYVDEA